MGETERRDQARRSALLLDDDLFFVSKITATLAHAGYATQTARRLDIFTQRLADRPAIALVNTAARSIDWRAGIAAARAANVPVIAYGSHVDTQTQAEARTAGATRVIANSKLATDLPGIVARTLSNSHEAIAESADEAVDE